MNQSQISNESSPLAAFLVLVAGSVIALAATDLVLPAIPVLPEVLGGNVTLAQGVLSSFVAGFAVGLVVIGELGSRFNQRMLLTLLLLTFAIVSWLAAQSTSLLELNALRVLQGFAAAAPAVFAPGIVVRLYEERAAIRAMGVIGSIESLVPALAPVLGVWLLARYDWTISFELVGVIAIITAALAIRLMPDLRTTALTSFTEGYRFLLTSPDFMRQAVSHALSLGGLLTFVFGAPVVYTKFIGVGLEYFVGMQICGISFFITAANLSSRIAEAIGAQRLVFIGTALFAVSASAIALYGFAGGTNPFVIIALFVPMNLGFGLRGPTGFYLAMKHTEEEQSRGSATILLMCFGFTAIGNLLAAPTLTSGFFVLASIAALFTIVATLLLCLPQHAGAEA